jgi:hypothetical protein
VCKALSFLSLVFVPSEWECQHIISLFFISSSNLFASQYLVLTCQGDALPKYQRVEYCPFLKGIIIMFSSIALLVSTYVFFTVVLVEAKVSTANLRNKEAPKTSAEHRRVSTIYWNA